MKNDIGSILEKNEFSKEDIVRLLSSEGEERRLLYTRAAAVKAEQVGRKVYYRGLVEFSNICGKNCLIIAESGKITKTLPGYNLGDKEILDAVEICI
jgi:biotin synthase